jgi:hypothetical protein
VKAAVGIKVIEPPAAANKVGTVIVLIKPAPTKFILFGVGSTKAVIPNVFATAVVPITSDTATVAAVAAPLKTRLAPVAAPIAGVTNAGLVNVPVLTVGFVIVGVAIAGLSNNFVLVMLLVVPGAGGPGWTNGMMSVALMTVATGKPEMATVVIIILV